MTELLSAPARHRLARITRWHPGLREVPVRQLLLGGQNGMSAAQFGTAMSDPLWASRRIEDGPHVALLRLARRRDQVTDEEILGSGYARMARACIRATGRYFDATDDTGILLQARAFLDGTGGPVGGRSNGGQHSPVDQPVLVIPIADSACYQIVDGHHRAAAAVVDGRRSVPVRVRRGTTSTPLQELLRRMSWLHGGRELYQPVVSPELESHWPTVRKCTDRMASIDAFLAQRLGPGYTGSYLDVASCYGWFVDQMAERGWDAEGMERDPLGAMLGRLVYGLDPERIRTGDAVSLLGHARERWDVVSCFSLLHHFVLGRGSCDEVELARLLDRVTGRVLFIDTGQEHEKWFRNTLRGWDPAFIQSFLYRHTTFDEIIDLGPDEDAVPPYAENYGRHLFACIRTTTGSQR